MNEYKWRKLGKIYSVNNSDECLLTHASNPLAVHLSGDIFRVYYSGRDSQNRSSVSYVDLDIITKTIINDYKLPIIKPQDNTFYSHGITIGNSWKEEDKTYIGFMGWQQNKGEHWRGDIGKFNVNDTSEISLVLGINKEDEISLSYPHVEVIDNTYRMWYGSTVSWTSINGEMVHILKSATTNDFQNWQFDGMSIQYNMNKAQAFSKPSVFKDEKGYHMWFSYRGGNGIPYRLGYSFSEKGKYWDMMKQSNLSVSESGWDSNMVCYPHVFKHKNNLYMLYNGNSYGRSGFGLAVAEN